MEESKYDFSGWVTKNDIKCTDGVTIKHGAFAECDGKEVPLIWNHGHSDVKNVLGKILLKNMPEGVYGYGMLNGTEDGQAAKELLVHGDITDLSICANKLKKTRAGEVLHGMIKEVSLVLSGANPGAHIEGVLAHSDEDGGEMYISDIGSANINVYRELPPDMMHSDSCAKKEEKETMDGDKKLEHSKEEKTDDGSGETMDSDKKLEHSKEEKTDDGSGETVQDVIDTMSEKQKNVMYYMVGEATGGEKKGEKEMKHNAFDNETQEDTIMHSEDIGSAITDGKKFGSMRESFLQHGLEDTTELMHADGYGINQIDYLMPEAKSLNNTPAFIQRKNEWVSKVMGGVHHTPFSRIKSVFADITEDDARAKGYMKGKYKKEEVFGLLKRTTAPTTIFKKQKMDRDDVNDITDFDVIAWLKAEMRLMLDEEIARAILIGDGRAASSDDKINEQNIRPIVSDEDLFTIKYKIGTVAGEDMIDASVRARKNYRGSGNTVCFTTEDELTEMLLKKDTQGYRLYKSLAELESAMRVSSIVTVPVMEGLKKTFGDDANASIKAIIVNLNDYNVGADKGGAVNMFDDFDIDYNQQKYLIETRCSGALTVPYSAIVLYAAV